MPRANDPPVIPGLLLDVNALERARRARDPRFDGRFFVGSVATGVYCRPICPTPGPNPGNARYYASAAAAAEAGFRPCLRCRPEAAPESAAWLGASAIVRRALKLIENGALDDGTVEGLARHLGVCGRHLRRLFFAHVGASPLAVAQTRRLQFAKQLIDQTDLPMTRVALESGFRSLRRFNAAIREGYGETPSALRGRHRGRAGDADRRRGGIVLRLPYRPPYDWQALLEHLRARAVPEIERVEAGTYTRNVVHEGKPARIVVRAPRDIAALELSLEGDPAGALLSLVARARRVFDVGVDPERVASVLRRDPLLAPLVAVAPGLRIPGVWDGFECAVRAVLAAGDPERERRLLSRIVRSSGSPYPEPGAPGGQLTHLFPTAQALAVADLEGLGVMATQARTVRELALALLERRLCFEVPSDELARALAACQGIDPGTVELIVLRSLGDPDAFPASVTASRALGGVTDREHAALQDRSQAWRPWRGYAALHLERAAVDGARASRTPAAHAG
ncbi:MAG TPA: AlkA N-terminal domain-containing protein [Woeseiaceae bacterium]